MRRGVLLAALCAVASTGVTEASATVLIDSAGRTPQPYQQWVHEAKVPTVAGPVWLYGVECPDGGGGSCTFSDRQAIWLVKGTDDQPVIEVRQTLLHELGHRFDYAMPQYVRDRFQAVMRDPRAWKDASGNAPYEQFAEAYGLCGLAGRLARTHGYGGYGYFPTVEQNRQTCALIRGLKPPS